MDYSLDQRTARLSIGEFSEFILGPRDSSDSSTGGLWRAQLGTHWHNQLRQHASASDPSHEFEIPIEGQIFHQGWTLTLNGRIDQRLRTPNQILLREIKTTLRALPVDEAELRADHPAYFAQLSTYLALTRLAAAPHSAPALLGELVFVEAGSGLSQTIPLAATDDSAFRLQLTRVVEFLEHQHRIRAQLRTLNFHPAFPTLRDGQQHTQRDLAAALERQPIVYFEAPTGFGKTGALLEAALTRLRDGHHDRLIYLTSKSTGQLQVLATLQAMTTPTSSAPITHNPSPITAPQAPLSIWHVRNKREHCINHTYACTRAHCTHLVDQARRFAESGLSRLYTFTHESRTLSALTAAGRVARICPYEITRAALPYAHVWIGDFNYLISPTASSLFTSQPSYDPARTLLIIDEAHNLPPRAADAYSHLFTFTDATTTLADLHHTHAPTRLTQAYEHWTHFLKNLAVSEHLSLTDEDDARDLLQQLAELIPLSPLDPLTTAPTTQENLWALANLAQQLRDSTLPLHWWSPRPGELSLTCLDAAPVLGPLLRAFGRVILATATLGPAETYTAALGLDEIQLPASDPIAPHPSPLASKLGTLTKRETKKLFTQLTTASALLTATPDLSLTPNLLRAHTPWRDQSYDLAIDHRADTTYQRRATSAPLTAQTLLALLAASRRHRPAPIAAFFPSYAYAELIQRELNQLSASLHPKIELQPRASDLAAQTAWLENALASAGLLFLVVGSSFAEGIDLFGGRITHALVAGPALPEVNPIQRARLAHYQHLGRDAAFHRVYQVPGMQKINQAIGRLVRAPGQHAKILLHCRRFAEPAYQDLLPAELTRRTHITSDADLQNWLETPPANHITP